jgi:hypothetical protein
MIKTKKITVEPVGKLFKVIKSSCQGWPNRGALLTSEEIQLIISKKIKVKIKK